METNFTIMNINDSLTLYVQSDPRGWNSSQGSFYLLSETSRLNDTFSTIKGVSASGFWAVLGLSLLSFDNFPRPSFLFSDMWPHRGSCCLVFIPSTGNTVTLANCFQSNLIKESEWGSFNLIFLQFLSHYQYLS